jgi:hypothetical protein
VGESCALPDICEPVTILRVDDPAEAVMVTDVALNACQFSVTLWPLLIAVVLVEKVIVGAILAPESPQAVKPHNAAIKAPQEIHRTAWVFIRRCLSPRRSCANQMPEEG